jgi:hypothetical protein
MRNKDAVTAADGDKVDKLMRTDLGRIGWGGDGLRGWMTALQRKTEREEVNGIGVGLGTTNFTVSFSTLPHMTVLVLRN